MTTDESLTPTNAAVPPVEAPVPLGAAESMVELRQNVAELARTLPGELRRLRVRGGEREIEVEWADPGDALESSTGPRTMTLSERVEGPAPVESSAPANEGLTAVRAPLVGSYYAAPSPGAEPFVRVGDAVEAGTAVAIIEAMKLMNTIVAGESGVVAEVLVSNGESVEYDQVLLHLRPKEQAA